MSAAAYATIKSSDYAVVLGIILENGAVLTAVGDTEDCRGHVYWIGRDRLQGVFRGFSLVVRKGRVTSLCRGSEVNATIDRQMEHVFVEKIEALLAGYLDDDYVYW